MPEVTEAFWNTEIEVEDSNNSLKAMFKPDYEHTKELERATIYISAEWIYITKLLKKRLRVEGASRIGTHFIRRRLTVLGLQLLNEGNTIAIAKRQEQYDMDLESFDPLSCILAAQPRRIFTHENQRVSLYLKEETLGWIQEIAEMFNVNTYTIIRICWGYTILKLIELNYLHEKLSENVEKDIALFKEFMLRKG